MTGQTIAHYQVVEKLGEGGMGVVWKARDTHLDRFVALKILPSDKVADPDRRRRFVQEARAVSPLNHANIVTVYDIDSAGDTHFIAMEYVAGRTLAREIPPGGLGPETVLDYARQVADALAAAHAAGIVHRDLKPANVMVSEEGRVKVLDFGLAKLAGPGDSTQTGAVVGTAAYMSPEQAEGRPVDPRSDLFSLGALLYEMAAGRPAFRRNSVISTLAPRHTLAVMVGRFLRESSADRRATREVAALRWVSSRPLRPNARGTVPRGKVSAKKGATPGCPLFAI